MSFHTARRHNRLWREVFPTQVISSVAPAENSVIQAPSWYCSKIISLSLHSRRVHPKCTWSRNDVGSQRSTSFIIFSTWDKDSAFFQPFWMVSTYTDSNGPCCRCTNRHSQFGIFCPSEYQQHFSNCLSHNKPTSGVTIQISFKRNHRVLNGPPRFWPLVSWKTYPYFWTFWLWNVQPLFGASSILT